MSHISLDLRGKTAVITGAASGIGRELAIGLAGSGASVALADINAGGLAETAAAISCHGRVALPIECDVTDPDQVQTLFSRARDELGGVHILINNAFIMHRERPEDLPLADWQRVVDVNLTGYFLCAQEAARHMMGQGGGAIVNISSIGGSLALGRGNFVYSVTKGAVNQLTRELAVEWAKHGIRVNAILPCQVRTPALQRLIADPRFDSDSLVQRFLKGIPLGRLCEPQDILGPVLFLVSDAASMVTGALLPVDGGNLALNAGGDHTC